MRKIIFLFAVSTVYLVFVSGTIAQPNKFWTMDIGNQWDYQGNCGLGCSYTSHDWVTSIDTTTFPFATYVITYSDSGSVFPSYEWYTISSTELRIWRIQNWDDVDYAYNTIHLNDGILWAKKTFQVGVPWSSSTTGEFTDSTGIPQSITVNVNSVVESYGPVTVPLGTYNAYKIHHDIQIIGLGSVTQNFWVIPYFGVVKREEINIEGTDAESLMGMNISTVFTDAPFNYWAYHYIMTIYDAGITTGYGDGRYGPEDLVLREQMAAFIVRAVEGEPPLDYCDSGIPFPDVTSDMWSCKYIKKLKERGITTGYQDGTYGPYDDVPREQMAAFLVRAVEGEPPLDYCDSGSLFPDVTPDMWSCKYIKRLKELRITTGYGDGSYGPYDYVTRAQMAAFLSRAFLGME